MNEETNNGLLFPARPSLGRNVLWIASVALIYFAAARLSLSLLFQPEGIAAIWPPAGIFLSAILLTRRDLRPWLVGTLFITDLMAEVLAGTLFIVSAVYALALTGDAVLSSWLLLRFVGEPITFRTVRDVAGWLTLSVLLSNALMSLVAAAASELLPGTHSFWNSWQWWAVSDGVGNLLVTPFILAWAVWARTCLRVWNRQRAFEGAALFIPLALLNFALFSHLSEHKLFMLVLPYLTFPFLLWAALRFGVRGVATALFILAAIAIPFAAAGRVPGFFLTPGILDGVIVVQLFLAITAVPSLFLAAVVTEREQTHGMLRQTEELHRVTLMSVGDAVISADVQGRVKLMNPVAETLTGWRQEEARGQRLDEVFRIINEDTRQAVESPVEHVLREGLVVGLANHTVLVAKDGTEWPIADAGAPIRDEQNQIMGVVLVFRDQTQERAAAKGLREKETRYRTLFEQSPDGVVIIDPQTALPIEFNEIAPRQLGYTREEFAHLRINDYEAAETPEVTKAHIEKILREGQADFETQHRTKTGEIRAVLVTVQTIELSGWPVLHCIFRDVTERKWAEQTLRESEEHYRSLFDNMLNGYAYCRMLFAEGRPRDFIYLDVNRAFETLTGLKDVVGKNVTAVIPGIRETDPQLFETYGRVALTGMPERLEIYVEALAMWFSISVYSPRKEYFVAVFDVITERKRAEQAVHESQARLASIVDSAMDGIVTIDDEERILVFNAAAEKMFGCLAGEAIGAPVERFIPERFRAAHHGHLRHFGQTGDTQRAAGRCLRVSGRRANGEEFPIEASISRTQVDGHLLFTVILRDVTERLRAEETRAQLEAQLRVAGRMEALGTLAGGIAHDFNNILGAIIGNAELARQDVAPGHPAMESLSEIRKASHRAKDLVQRILAFGCQQPQPQSVIALRPVVEEAVALLRATLPAGVELATACDADTPSVLADPTQIHQVLMNLCTNAWHALYGHIGRIDIRLDGITVDAEAARADTKLWPGRFARLCVTDNGSGMDTATLERIFDPFFTTKPVGQGTGLGLSVVHGIVEAHGGAVTVRSQQGTGTTFSLYFPAAEAPQPSAAPEGAAAEPLPAAGGQHVLYLDDEEPLVFLVTRLLKRLGYRVSGYTQAAAALAAVRADPGQFDLVVTDLNLPGSSGLEVARELSRLRPDLPVVLTSGYITDEIRAAAPQAGVRQLVYKPNMMEELREVVQRLAGAPKTP